VQSDDSHRRPVYATQQHGVIAKSQREEESALLRRKVEELDKNTARLIVEAGKLIQESKQLSAQIKSLESPSTKPEWPHQRTIRPLSEILIVRY
jgi:hypothetical protein